MKEKVMKEKKFCRVAAAAISLLCRPWGEINRLPQKDIEKLAGALAKALDGLTGVDLDRLMSISAGEEEWEKVRPLFEDLARERRDA